MTLGEKIQELRKLNGMSQEYLAEQLEVSRQAISKWENEQSIPSSDNLFRLSKLFNISVEQLINPNSRVELVMEVRKEIIKLKKSKSMFFFTVLSLVLFIGTFANALYGRISGYYDQQTVLYLIITSVGFMLFAFLPIVLYFYVMFMMIVRAGGLSPHFG